MISTGVAILALLGLALGLVVAGLVALLLQQFLRPLLEAERYARDILDAGVGIATNLDAVDELETTRRLGGAVPGLAVAYLKKLGLL